MYIASYTLSIHPPHQLRLSDLLPLHLPPNPPPPTPPAPLLIHPHRIHKPIRVLKHARVLLHIRLARSRLVPATTLRPHLPRPRPAERSVEHKIHVLEVLGDIAAPRVVRERGAPFARVGTVGRDVRWDRSAREEPDGDGLGGPLGCVDAAAEGVEAGAEVRRVVGQDGAAGVLGLRGRVRVAVGRVDESGHAGRLNRAAGRGVQGHGVGRSTVNAFNDINLAH